MAVVWKVCFNHARCSAQGALTALISAIVLLLSHLPTQAADVGALIKKLDQTEWEIVSGEVSKRIPDLILGKEEQDHFKALMQSSQEMAAMAEALQYGNYKGLGSLSANILARDLEAMATRRFGKESRLYKSIQLVKKHPTLAKELTRAALNADAYEAGRAIRKSLREYAEKEAAALRKQGENFWKDMIRRVVPGNSALSKLGVDPVDLYLQGIRDWSDFTSRARLRFNNGMLDCLALRYRKIRDGGGSHQDARLEIENFDTGTGIGSNFNCSAEMRRQSGQSGNRSFTQRFVDFFRSTGRSTAALSELGMTSGEVVDLIQQYENAGGSKRGDFSDWLQDRLLQNIKTRADGLMSAINEAQNKAANKQISEAKQLMAAIEAEIAKLERDKPGKKDGKQPGGKDKPTNGQPGGETQTSGRTGDGDDDDGTSGGDPNKDKDAPEPEKVTAQCDALRTFVRLAERQQSSASSDKGDKVIANLDAGVAAARAEGNCPADVYASADAVRTRLQTMAGLRERFQQAISACDVNALQSLKSEASRVAPNAFDNEVTLLQTAKTGVDQFKRGKGLFDLGDYRSAKTRLERALSALQELPSGACQTYVERAQEGLERTNKILAQQVIVDKAINTCDVAGMKKILNAYQGRKLRFFKVSVARIKTALPDCEEKDRIIAQGKFCEAARRKLNAARSDFQSNQLSSARRTLIALQQKLTNENTKHCSDLPARVQQGLDNIKILKAEYDRLTAAEKRCRVQTLKKLLVRFRRKEHVWYKSAAKHAVRVIKRCNKKTRQDAVASCRQQVANQGKVYAKTQFHKDGSYNCHWCEPGHSFVNGQCWSVAALADAQCRRDIARQGRVFARVEFLPDGRYVCHSCPPRQIYATDGKCWTQTAFVEARCRHDVARMGKVFARAIIQRNGQYRCLWCEPGMYYRNGRCYSPQQDIARGVAAINGIIEQIQRGSSKGRRQGRTPKPGRRTGGRTGGGSRPPPKCIENGFVNRTDPRCKSYW